MNRVAVVVVAHDSGPLLAHCVARVLADPACAELIVVDNASGDGSLQAVRAMADARVRIECLGRNAGFAVACNHGANATAAPWLAFLNPDALVESDSFSRLLHIAANDASIGLLGADVRGRDGAREAAARRRDPSLGRILATQIARLPGCGGWSGRGLEIAPRDEALSEVDACSGALMLLPRALFERVGGFDPGYFLHAEDLDLCRRVRGAGRRVLVANQVAVTHVQGSSSRARPFFVIWHKHRSLWRYFATHEGVRLMSLRGGCLLVLLAARVAGQCLLAMFRRR